MKKSKGKNSALKDRLKKSYDSKDKGGGNRPSALDWKKLPDGMKFFKPKEGKNRINIIPYIVKTKNDPLVHSGDAKIGDQSYMLDLWIHRSIGPTQAEVICPQSNFNKPCPICRQAKEFKDAGKKDEAAALWPKRQCFYNIIDVKNPDLGIQVFAISHYLFEKELIEEARADSDDGDIIDFVDIDDGKMIEFRASETSSPINGKTVTFLEYKSFSFKDRDEPLESTLVDDAVSFDELMKLNTAEEIEKIMFGEDEENESDDDDDDDEDEKPAKKATKKPAKKVINEDDDDDDEEEDDDNEENDDNEEEDDEPPVKAKAKVSKKPPVKKEAEKPTKVTTGKCPHKHKFGIDNDKFEDDCEDCEVWADCLKEKNNLKKAKAKK